MQAWFQVTDELARNKIGHAMRDGQRRELERIDPSVFQELLSLIPGPMQYPALQPLAAMVLPMNIELLSWNPICVFRHHITPI
jgi:hypothetical protein